MKTHVSFTLALLGGIALLTNATFAQTWQIIDDFQYAPGIGASAISIARDPSGNILVSGSVLEATAPWKGDAMVQKSGDGGATWSVSDDFSTGGTGGTFDYGITSDYLGNLYH